MAVFKLLYMQDIRGSIGNIVHSAWNGRHYLRQNAQHIGNPKTHAQQGKLRKRLSELVQRWLYGLNNTQRAGWESFAKLQGSKSTGESKKGEECIIPQNGDLMTGRNAFIMCNMLIRSIDSPYGTYPPIDDAPVGINPPTMPEKVSCVYEEDVITTTVRTPLSWGPPRPGALDLGRVRLWIKPLRFAPRIAVTASADPDTEIPLVVGGYGELDTGQALNPGKYIVCVDAVNSWGLRSAPSAKNYIVVPQPTIP